IFMLATNKMSRAGEAVDTLVRQGQWWRLLTSAFLHANLLHLACNMISLYSVGGFVEQAWGRWRWLVIYFVAAWGSSCLALAYHPSGTRLVGASGAICGLLGAVGVWFLLYGRYLPSGMGQRGLWQVGLSVALIALCGYLP